MATKTRQINNEKYNIEQLVDMALAAVSQKTYNARAVTFNLERMKITNPTEAQIEEMALLDVLARATGAAFQNQFGRGLIDMSSRERAIETVNSYLNRRVQGQRSAFTQQYRR